jgi:hypothetical protein
MSQLVVNGAQLQCVFGAAPSALIVIPQGPPAMASNMPIATIMDNKPTVNIPPFGMCNSPNNPQVIAATAAAMGVFTPQPCVPVIPAPWAPGAPTVMIGGKPALTNVSKCMCAWAGMISINMPGQLTAQTT